MYAAIHWLDSSVLYAAEKVPRLVRLVDVSGVFVCFSLEDVVVAVLGKNALDSVGLAFMML